MIRLSYMHVDSDKDVKWAGQIEINHVKSNSVEVK